MKQNLKRKNQNRENKQHSLPNTTPSMKQNPHGKNQYRRNKSSIGKTKTGE